MSLSALYYRYKYSSYDLNLESILWKLLQNDCNSTFVLNASLCCIIVVLSILQYYFFSQFKWNVCWSGPSLLWVYIKFSYTFFRASEQADRSVLIILKVIQWWAVTLLVVPFTFFSVSLGSQLGGLQIRCIISSQSRRTIICLMGRSHFFHLDVQYNCWLQCGKVPNIIIFNMFLGQRAHWKHIRELPLSNTLRQSDLCRCWLLSLGCEIIS